MKQIKAFLRTIVHIWWWTGNVFFIIVMTGLVVSLFGFPKELEETQTACIYTETGETISCEVQIRGEVTNYPFRKYADYALGVYYGNITIAELAYDTSDLQEKPYAFQQIYRYAAVKDIVKDILVVEMDVHVLFPERESQRCVLVTPAADRNTAMEIVNNSGGREEFMAPFAWLIGQ